MLHKDCETRVDQISGIRVITIIAVSITPRNIFSCTVWRSSQIIEVGLTSMNVLWIGNCSFFASGQQADAAITHQRAALFCLKRLHGCHLESVTSS